MDDSHASVGRTLAAVRWVLVLATVALSLSGCGGNTPVAQRVQVPLVLHVGETVTLPSNPSPVGRRVICRNGPAAAKRLITFDTLKSGAFSSESFTNNTFDPTGVAAVLRLIPRAASFELVAICRKTFSRPLGGGEYWPSATLF